MMGTENAFLFFASLAARVPRFLFDDIFSFSTNGFNVFIRRWGRPAFHKLVDGVSVVILTSNPFPTPRANQLEMLIKSSGLVRLKM